MLDIVNNFCHHDCLVSIIMPVYNVEQYVGEAIDSILNQTYKNIELIIIDDCSTDGSANVVKSYNDSRIKFISNKVNLQQPRTRNIGLELAKGKYIACMDSDDICLPNRIEVQVDFMEKHQDIDLCGSYFKTFGSDNEDVVKTPIHSEDCSLVAMYTSPFGHSTVMFRNERIDRFNIRYDANYRYSQDFELWSRLVLQGAKICNIPEVLLKYRENPSGVTFGHPIESQLYTNNVIYRNIKKLYNIDLDKTFNSVKYNSINKKVDFLRSLKYKSILVDCFNEKQIEQIINGLIKWANDNKNIYSIRLFFHELKFLLSTKSIVWCILFFMNCISNFLSKKGDRQLNETL